MSNENHSRHAAHHGTDSFRVRWRGRFGKVKRYFQEQHAKRAGEQPERKAARNTTRATIVIALFTVALAVVGWLQYQEVQDSNTSIDRMNRIYRDQAAQLGRQAGETHDLAIAAGKQADASKAISDRTKDVADRMKDQADQTRIIANQAVIQANAAKSAADTAKDALHVSERAYLTLGSPTNDFQNGRIEIPILNGGHLPSGHVKIVEHEATFVGVAFTGAPIPLSSIVETHWTATGFPSVPVVQNGGIYNVEVQLPKLIQADFNAGKQSILIVVVVTYNDGFEGTPDQSWITCDASTYDTDKKLLTMRPCQDPTPFLTLLNTIDHYPDPSYEIK
jgi:hypothetical protein